MSNNHRIICMKRPDTTLLVSQVYDILWQEIVQRKLKPNEKLDINHLAKEMGVSRTPVMDALARLENDGLVSRRNRVGTFVTPISKSTFVDLFASRDMVEQYMTPIAIASIKPKDIQSLQEILGEMERLTESVDDQTFDYGAYTRYDHDFHLMLVKLCGNTQIINFYQSLNSHMQIARAYSRFALKRATEGLEEHRNILNAFIAGDVEQARLHQRSHLEHSRDDVLKILDDHDFL